VTSEKLISSSATFKKWSDMIAPMLPPASYNSSRSFFIPSLSPTALKILLVAATNIPLGVEWAIGSFLVRGEAINPKSQATSSFVLREKFGFLHALAPVKEESRLGESRQWTDGILREMREVGLVKAGYLALSGLDVSVGECFGKSELERLRTLKRRVDPGNLFRNVPAQFVDKNLECLGFE